jgi:hypothetical protein
VRLGDLANTGEKQPHTDAPEYEPFADQRHKVGAAVTEQRFGQHRKCRKDKKEECDENEIHAAINAICPRMK